jgi:hypothetical protein
MNESIRARRGVSGQLLDGDDMVSLARGLGRPAAQRTTLYLRPQATGALERVRSAAARVQHVQAEMRGAVVIEG